MQNKDLLSPISLGRKSRGGNRSHSHNKTLSNYSE